MFISSFIRESKINTLFGLIFVWTNFCRFFGFSKLPPSSYHYTTLKRSCKRVSQHKQQHRHIFYVIIFHKETGLKIWDLTSVIHTKHWNIIHTVNLICANSSKLHVPENIATKINPGKVFGILIY